MRIGIPRESKVGETLVAATAATASRMVSLGYEVVVEAGAGLLADQPDWAYGDVAVKVGDAAAVWDCDIIAKVNPPTPEEIRRLSPGALVISLMAPARSPELIAQLKAAGVTALALDAVPRISRAQSMDVLSSMANVAGYRAVIEAAHEFSRQFTGQVTAAGKVPPAKVFVVGAGVAGLAAIGTAGSMGAVVRAFDLRPEVAEQVTSMGAQFVSVDMDREASSDGYATEMTEAQAAATAAMYDAEARDADIVITTALIPGRPAPLLVTEETVNSMRAGSVIVDMAAGSGGNVASTRAHERYVTDNGVTILGYTDLASRLAAQSSQLFGTNLVNLLSLLTPAGDGEVVLDMEDVIQRSITVVREGSIMWPPPPVTVSVPAPSVASAPEPEPVRQAPPNPGRHLRSAILAAGVFAIISWFSPSAFLGHFTVFALAVIVGFYVISNVHHALHTPLMSETNAISGIILVGGLLQVGSENVIVSALAVSAVLVASINVFGGFLVTRRMLEMFRKD